jgi:hypothetical protein
MWIAINILACITVTVTMARCINQKSRSVDAISICSITFSTLLFLVYGADGCHTLYPFVVNVATWAQLEALCTMALYCKAAILYPALLLCCICAVIASLLQAASLLISPAIVRHSHPQRHVQGFCEIAASLQSKTTTKASQVLHVVICCESLLLVVESCAFLCCILREC